MEQWSLGCIFDTKDSLDQLFLSPFQKQNIKKEHNINAHLSKNFAYIVLKVPFWQFVLNQFQDPPHIWGSAHFCKLKNSQNSGEL